MNAISPAELPAREAAPIPGEDLLGSEVLGGGLPSAAEHHLKEAGRAYQRDALAEWHLRSARQIAPDHAAVLIALYRFYFYKNRLAEALEVAVQCVSKAARDNGLAENWRDVQPADARFGDYDAVLPRFYLFSLKGYAYLNLRLGNLDEGRDAVARLLEIDPSDKVGAKVLLGVIGRIGQVDEE